MPHKAARMLVDGWHVGMLMPWYKLNTRSSTACGMGIGACVCARVRACVRVQLCVL